MIRFSLLFLAITLRAGAAETPVPAVERQVADAVKAPGVTVVHLWAPWCSNCKDELANQGWSTFIAAHPDVNFVFVTVWNDEMGREVLAQNGVGAEKNFTLLLHPNGSRLRETADEDVPWHAGDVDPHDVGLQGGQAALCP